ncbi:hypothetical protein BSKO_08748 [Bryopsis sp. KO-2023]|nr:hypothetical protein BSKO_08748 [Bryopsis sp. KO-2023]
MKESPPWLLWLHRWIQMASLKVNSNSACTMNTAKFDRHARSWKKTTDPQYLSSWFKKGTTRLFPQNSREGDRNGNVVPGTIVDSGIVGPKDFEFFLNSQAGIQGTNKPAHYRVLVDENGFGSDGIQLMTYWMCFLYCRCTR